MCRGFAWDSSGSALIFVWWLLLPLGLTAIWLVRRRFVRRALAGRE